MSTIYNQSIIHLHNLSTQIQKSKNNLAQKIARFTNFSIKTNRSNQKSIGFCWFSFLVSFRFFVPWVWACRAFGFFFSKFFFLGFLTKIQYSSPFVSWPYLGLLCSLLLGLFQKPILGLFWELVLGLFYFGLFWAFFRILFWPFWGLSTHP